MNVESARQLAEIIVSVGLAQNLTALKALSTEGVQKGHKKLHAKNIAVMAGATGEKIEIVAKKIVEAGKVRVDFAKEILSQTYKV
jgi:hydroxymethylglutaryl-CoA reductase